MACWPPADWLFALPLEAPYDKFLSRDNTTHAIVVLAANVDKVLPYTPPIPDASTYARGRYAAWLYNRARIPILVSGGRTSDGSTLASVVASVLRAEGVPSWSIIEEGASTDTHENAEFTARMLQERSMTRIVLVMEAQTMMRAHLCISRSGIEVVPAAFSRRGVPVRLGELLPSCSAIRRNEITLHDVVGLVWYKLPGWV